MLPFSMFANAQIDSTKALTDTSQIKFIEPPDSTGFGIPDGKLMSKEIGPAGGTIVSDDGRIELIFPPGALTENTATVSNRLLTCRPTVQAAYRCEPQVSSSKSQYNLFFIIQSKKLKPARRI